MESFLDSTLLTILVIISFATILALIRAQKRDRCLTHFDGYHVTLAEKDGEVTWGLIDVRTSGMEISYPDPRVSKKGFWKQSFLFYKDQYEAMDGVYRCTAGLTETQKRSRRRYLERTANPGIFWRTYRMLRNWVGMIRDALVQTTSLLIGVAKSRAQPTAAVLTRDEERVSTLSAEIIGHAGNAYDPLLEKHLFTRVIIDVTRQGETHQYCGYLADYTSDFLEIIDAQVNAKEHHFESKTFTPSEVPVDNLEIDAEEDQLRIRNDTGKMLLLHELRHDEESIAIGAVIPSSFSATLRLGADIDPQELELVLATPDRVDMLVPRSHSLVRHGVSGLRREDLEPNERTFLWD